MNIPKWATVLFYKGGVLSDLRPGEEITFRELSRRVEERLPGPSKYRETFDAKFAKTLLNRHSVSAKEGDVRGVLPSGFYPDEDDIRDLFHIEVSGKGESWTVRKRHLTKKELESVLSQYIRDYDEEILFRERSPWNVEQAEALKRIRATKMAEWGLVEIDDGTLPTQRPVPATEEARALVVNMPPRVSRRSLRARLFGVSNQDQTLVTIHLGTKKYSGTVREVRDQLFREPETDEDVDQDIFIDAIQV